MSNVFLETAAELLEVAKTTESVAVSFSGGKDSRAVLDMCARAFKHVFCFHMYFVPGLRVVNEQLEIARERYGATVLHYPHWTLFRVLKNGSFRFHGQFDDLPDIGLGDIHRMVMADTGVRHIMHGGKLCDSLWRRRQLGNAKGIKAKKRDDTEGCIYPIKHWTKSDVLAYLEVQKISVPENDASSGGGGGGVCLSTPSVLWLYDKHREDYERLKFYFPFVGAIVKRREWFGVS
jgi:3'-phosphoadenosine 5'-phosphosulfate sulfotransferase (PAPS reductase)/FAD synthetase